MMLRGVIQIVRTDTGHHVRIVASNGEPIVWGENHPDERDAINALRVLAETFANGPATVTRDWVTLPADEDELGEKYALPVHWVTDELEGSS